MPKQIFAKEYEEYLITGKEEALNSLASGSIEKEYFTLIRRLLKEELTPELQTDIESFLSRIPESQSYRLRALNIFKKIQKKDVKKTEIIDDIKRLFRLGNVRQYSKPVKYNKTIVDEKDENESQKLPNSLNISSYIKTNKFIEGIYSGEIVPIDKEYDKVMGINVNATLNFDFNKIPEKTLVQIFTKKKDFKKIFIFVIQSITYAEFDYFKKVMKSTIEKCLNDEKTKKEFRNIVCDNISFFLNEQINYLLEYKTDFNFDRLLSELINRKYSTKINDKTERVKVLKEIIELLNKFNCKDDRMTRNVLLTILDLNSQMNIYELETFIDYIKVPLYNNSRFYNISQDLQTKIRNNDIQRDCFLSQAINFSFDQDKKIIEKYLKHFYLKEKMPFEKLNKYFNENYIKEFYSEMQFYLGSEEPTKDNILSSYTINELMKETKLSICDFNKEEFNINDDVELVLEIKNIQTLYVNIYEINTENYYYSNKKNLMIAFH
jgi:hypothetical protein